MPTLQSHPKPVARRRQRWHGTWAAAVLLAGAAAYVVAPWPAALYAHLYPGCRAPRLTAVPHLTGVWTGRSYAYLLEPEPVANSAGSAGKMVLIDTGSDPRGAALLRALAELRCTPACVGTVLLTHGHSDHTAALALFAHAEVLAHPADGALLRGDVGPRAQLMRTAMRMAPRQRHALATSDLYPGQVLKRAGHAIEVVGLPGHTAGSVGFLWGGGLLAGDAVDAAASQGSAMRPMAEQLADCPKVLGAALLRLADKPVAWVADGHSGLQFRYSSVSVPQP